ncbi:DNA helicase [Paenibacillus marchantiophytorum]|uniref:DNA 3'-5' helicase n=1 Tax=Paenibacillus marchantiophytorum TaxID=1619310 RepID=A0ABQ1EZ35_9BACL|nr:ATP-dependent helicase [Paenibacillus marchantiophytorum]GFZ94132.1 DNA helicase [Paenibacillus marchantiophytorum]
MGVQLVNADSQIDMEQHFKITAGPGAGKTRFLIRHIKNVLHNSTRLGRNRKIACITYTNVGVETILQRLGDEVDYVEVCTIHSFLFTHIVKPYLHLISDKHEINHMKVDAPYEHIVSNGYFRMTDLSMKKIQEQEMKKVFWFIDGDSCKLHIRGRKSDFHKSLLKYKKMFWEKGIIHYDDVLAFAWEILNSSKETLRIIRSKFPYFFIDEFQDTNPVQTEIIKLIAEKETIVGVIGDKAQSIYEFQGADVKQFDNYILSGMVSYKMEDNHRSSENIINLLNGIRKDIVQRSPDLKEGNLPSIIVGQPLQALKHIQDIVGEEQVTTLSYSNLMANSMRNNTDYEDGQKWMLIEDAYIDSNPDRRKIFISMIKAIEYARLSHYKEAIKELSRHLRMSDDYNGQKTSLIVIKMMLDEYHEYSNRPLWIFYEKLLGLAHFKFPKIRESKDEKTASEIEIFYKNTLYSNIALNVKIAEDDSLHRTIHKAKGSEFDNVLVIVKGRDGYKYNEERDLGFLLNPDIDGNEDHRVNYVACSRAKKKLFINLPEISETAKKKLEVICIRTLH